MPRFVLLHHECPPGYVKPSHWDFMLEFGDVLWTWELRELPAGWRGSRTSPPKYCQPLAWPIIVSLISTMRDRSSVIAATSRVWPAARSL